MSTAFEIQGAVKTLPTAEYAKLLTWLDERQADRVDAYFEEAVLSGKFDVMAQQAVREISGSESGPLPRKLRL